MKILQNTGKRCRGDTTKGLPDFHYAIVVNSCHFTEMDKIYQENYISAFSL